MAETTTLVENCTAALIFLPPLDGYPQGIALRPNPVQNNVPDAYLELLQSTPSGQKTLAQLQEPVLINSWERGTRHGPRIIIYRKGQEQEFRANPVSLESLPTKAALEFIRVTDSVAQLKAWLPTARDKDVKRALSDRIKALTVGE